MQVFEEFGTQISPISYSVGLREDYVGRGDSRQYTTVNCWAHRIPLRPLIKNFFSLKNVLSSTLNYMSRLATQKAVENFVQGASWKNRLDPDGISINGKVTIPYILYYDDFETGNPLGSSAGVHSLGGIYIWFPSLAIDFPSGTFASSSSLDKILVAGVFHSTDRKSFGNEAIFGPIIEDINDLYLNGIDFNLSDYSGRVYFQLALLSGDNLGLHALCGFVESFNCNRCSRYCRITKGELHSQVREDPSLVRNPDNYFPDLLEGNCAVTGVKQKSIWS